MNFHDSVFLNRFVFLVCAQLPFTDWPIRNLFHDHDTALTPTDQRSVDVVRRDGLGQRGNSRRPLAAVHLTKRRSDGSIACHHERESLSELPFTV